MKLQVDSYTIPTESPESDGTLEWCETSLVVVHAHEGDLTGLGYSYTSPAAATVVRDQLGPLLEAGLSVSQAWDRMVASVRNLGLSGIAACAISAVDCALWDLEAHRLGLSLAGLLGAARREVPIYASGGFTSSTPEQLVEQMQGWVEQGIPRLKMKVGRSPEQDPERVARVRAAVGPEPELFVDANGAYSVQQALWQAERLAQLGVSWLEEPRPSDDPAGLARVRRRAPAGLEVAAGEYGYRPSDFRLLIESGAVDVLQADVTRCLGYTGFLLTADLCAAFGLDLSAHCAPALSLPACCAARRFRHQEYFFDHVRIEQLLFDGFPARRAGVLLPDFTRPGHGLSLKRKDAERYHD